MYNDNEQKIVEKKELVITRFIHALVEHVWKAWTDSKSILCMRASQELGGDKTVSEQVGCTVGVREVIVS